MPPELVDYDFDANRPDGLIDLSLSHDYNVAWTAHEAGYTPAAFRLLPWDEQAELTAFYYVQGRISTFHAEQQTAMAEKKRHEYEAKANANARMRR